MRVSIVDNDARARSALRLLLEQEPGLAVDESSDLKSLATQVREFKPDLVLLDWELPGRAAFALLLALSGFNVLPDVIVLSLRPESEQAALDAGAIAFVCKSDPPESLLAVLHSLRRSKKNDSEAFSLHNV